MAFPSASIVDPQSNHRDILKALSENILAGLGLISVQAARELQRGAPRPDPLLSAEGRASLRRIFEDNLGALKALRREPAIARVEVEWQDDMVVESFYVCRASTAGFKAAELGAGLVSYKAEMGKLAEVQAGEVVDIHLPHRRRRQALVLTKVQMRPKFTAEDNWDAFDNVFDLLASTTGVESLRALIKHFGHSTEDAFALPDLLAEILDEEQARSIFFNERRRKTVSRMALRDQPVLDQYQGQIFRLPLDRQLILLGPPGTGKTTTLIKRLAQKRTNEALTQEERELLERYNLEDDFRSENSWVMFSPTALLKLYVKEAFNNEGVPATNYNLRTWGDERRDLGRNVLKFLRANNSGKFTIAENERFLIDESSPALSRLFDEFRNFADDQLVTRAGQALNWMETSGPEEARQLAALIRSRLGSRPLSVQTLHELNNHAELLHTRLEVLRGQIQQTSRQIVNVLLAPDKNARLAELAGLLKGSNDDEVEDDEDDDYDLDDEREGASDAARAARRLVMLVRSLGRETATGKASGKRSVSVRLASWIGDRQLDEDLLYEIGENVQFERRVRWLHDAARHFVSRLPAMYTKFRRQCAGEGRYYLATAAGNRSKITTAEADLLILGMLLNARRTFKILPHARWLDSISSRYFMQVFVDEATDFSAVELACMMTLAHPQLRSFFACGDFRQRLTGSGIRTRDELDWVRRTAQVPDFEAREVSSNYRQSKRLQDLALAVFDEPRADAEEGLPSDDPAPVLSEGLTGTELGKWLAERIIEVERHVGSLPSIAIFVESEDRIDEVVQLTSHLLQEENIRVVGCKDGLYVGLDQEVRVFNVTHIKGLEFEAVFFLGVDRLADRFPDLLRQYLYVGITRAATFLGICCEQSLPSAIEQVRPHMSVGTWG